MALTLDGATGLFAKVGAFYKAIVNAEATTGLTDEDRAVIISNIRVAAQKYLIAAVQADTPIKPTLEAALVEVVKQAIDQSESVDRPSVSTSASLTALTALSYRGTGAALAWPYDRFGQYMYGARPHTLRLDCVQAPLVGYNYTAQWAVSSTPLLPATASTWFSGLGYNGRIGMATGQVDGAAHIPNQNILTNGSFERFDGTTANVPDNWTLSTFVAGTHVDDVSTPYAGSKALKIIGDGATNGKIRQLLNDATGAPVNLQPRTGYVLSIMYRGAVGALTAGAVRLSIEDAAGNELYTSGSAVNLTGASTTWAELGTFFYTGDTISATNYVVLESTTAFTNTEVAYFDDCLLVPTVVVPGFGRIMWAEGSVAAQDGDFATFATTNDATGLQLVAWERLFDMSRFDLVMPTNGAGSETITDSISVTTPN